MHHLYFYEVLDRLMNTKEQLKASRAKWKGKHYIKINIKDGEDGPITIHTIVGEKGIVYSPYTANAEDLLADDWIIEY